MAAPFDVRRLEFTGSPVAIVENIVESVVAGFDFSRLGSLVYIPRARGSGNRTLVWVDRKGAAYPLPLPPQRYRDVRFSPDGRRLAVSKDDDAAVWLYDSFTETFSRFTFGGHSGAPTWSPDGKRLAFVSYRNGRRWTLYTKPTDGSGPEELLVGNEYQAVPQSWSPDGRALIVLDFATGRSAISVLPVEGQRQSWYFSQTPFVQIEPTVSPNGRWLAYASDETGRYEIYVQPFPGPGGKWQISTEGGREPVWARNGKELFYRNGRKMMAVDPIMQPRFTASKPRMLFEGRYASDSRGHRTYDVTPDGQRFVMIKPSEQELAATQINVVLNWFEDLKGRVGPGPKQ